MSLADCESPIPPRTATRLLVLTIMHVHERRPDARHPTSIGVFTRAHTDTLGFLAMRMDVHAREFNAVSAREWY